MDQPQKKIAVVNGPGLVRPQGDLGNACLTGYPLAKRFSLASPSMLLPSKPLPPISKSSPSIKASKMCHGEQESGKPGIGLDEESRMKKVITSEEKECQDPAAEDKRSSLNMQVPVEGICQDPAAEAKRRLLNIQVRDALGKLAEKNIQRKKMELLEKEMKRRQKETSLKLLSKAVEPRHAAETSLSLPPVNGTVPLHSVERKDTGSAMKKRVVRKQDNVPLLPSTPTLHGDGSFPCSSSVTPQTATGAKRREEPLRGRGQKDGAFSDPQQSLQEALSMLDSDDWELKKKGLLNIPRLAESHPEVLLCRLREICLAATSEVTNLRSKVSCSAIVTLGELFAILKKDMDSEADEVAAVLLPMVWNSPEFIQKAACQSLGMMVENVTPARAMTVLMDRGVKSRYVQVRKCAAELLLSLMEKMGVTKLAGTPRAERLPHVAGILAQDCHKDTSYSTVQCQEMENQQGECSSVKEPVKKRNDGSKEPQASLPSSIWVKSAPGGRLLHRPKAQVTLPATVEGRESLQKLYHLLEAKGFQARMEGVALLLDLCKTSPQLISSNIVQIFDHFVLRINDTHKKVKQQALEVLAEIIGVLEDALNPVMKMLVEWVHARSPEVVQRYALPVLWSCLENKELPLRSANVCAVVTNLACALCEVMGTQLIKCAESKPPHSWHGGLKELQTEGKVKTNHGSASEEDQEEAAD
ncbi:TOG array regulator of axonemal microtubules protein 2-like [Ammospiza caudacuta]|uniref:TOG array regulator of axonemal microtubules protein 2-like n=1 Tax=Ammospiza caudacuta TaxID=2857398 RepID=UPI0027392A30|nr:TOG array regulator of axonemal microtubules protein 2-like [Ammospiza caudacuta]